MLYECLTGVQPYEASDQVRMIAAHLARPAPQPSRHDGVPPGFNDVIACGMAKDPADRYDSAGELAAAARLALAGTTPPPAVKAETPATAVSSPSPTSFVRRRRIAILVAAVGVMVAGLVAAVPLWTGRHAKPATPAASTTFARVSATIPVGKHPEGVAVDPGLQSAYTADYGANAVSVIDTKTHTVTATIPIGRGPIGIAVDPMTHAILTANNRDDTVSVIDTTARAVAATIRAGANPWGITIDPATHTAYATNSTDGTVAAIDTDTRTLTSSINVGNRLWDTAIDLTTHTVYTADSSGTMSVIEAAHRS